MGSALARCSRIVIVGLSSVVLSGFICVMVHFVLSVQIAWLGHGAPGGGVKPDGRSEIGNSCF